MSENGGGWPQSPRPPRHSRGSTDPLGLQDPGSLQDPRAFQDPRNVPDPRARRDPRSLPNPRIPQAPRVPQDPRVPQRPQGPSRPPVGSARHPDEHLRPLPPGYEPVHHDPRFGETRPARPQDPRRPEDWRRPQRPSRPEPLQRNPGPPAQARAELARLAASEGAIEVIVGLPTSLSGREGTAAAGAREFAADLAGRLAPVPVRLVDERFTTTEAHDALRRGGKDARARRQVVDAAAAAVLLQAALDAERATGRPPGHHVRAGDGAGA